VQSLKPIILIALLFFLAFPSLAQKKGQEPQRESCVEITNKKALKLFEQGKDKKKYEKRERMHFLKQAIEEEPDFVDAMWLYVEEMIKTAKSEGTSLKGAEKYLERIIELCPNYDQYAYFYLGQLAFNANRFSASVNYLEKFLKKTDDIRKDEDYTLAKNMSKKAKEFAAIFENPVPFDPKCVEKVSTAEDEYLAIISPDNETMYFTRRIPPPVNDKAWSTTDDKIEVFSLSKRQGEHFEKGQALPYPFNRGDNYGGATVTPDNKHMYITVCRDTLIGVTNRRYKNCDIYTSDFVNGEWTLLRNLGPNVNTPDGWESQPSISSDNRTLYFSSYREDSRGMDIYFSQKQANGEWGPAQNIGEPINTDKHEKSPFIHSDSQTLYFSSDGHTGVGGFDIYMVKADEKGKWQKPKNIGYPINTENDEVGFFVSTDGQLGYFASNSLHGKCKGGYDVFSFPLYKEARPEEVVFIRGEIKSDDGRRSNASVKIKNSSTQKITEVLVDSTDGKYVAIVAVKKDDDLVVTVKQYGKAFSSNIVKATEDMLGKPRDYDTQVKEVKVGGAYRLENINYATNSADLTPESLIILDEFIEFLDDNPGIKIAIHGHTDDVGKDDFNLALSTDRAFSVMAYLQQKGIEKGRLSFKGFGKTKPLVPNASEENRAINRRTEFVIISK
jgi:outer membrane protein OmpA-like peptidoglycan-associated protein/tetratricopeptide (TPR) repeat protein